MNQGDGITARLKVQRPRFTLDVDLQLPGSGFIALFGPSGCGKTTCLRALAGLERAKPGQVRVGGTVWQDDASHVWLPTHERALGYVFQEASLFDHLSVKDNISYGLKRGGAHRRGPGHPASKIAPAAALERAIELLGISALLDRRPIYLSGGERQRVAIARALATQPRVLLMDEPLAALDAARKAEVLPYLETLQRTLDIPVIYVSHALEEVARLATHMVLMDAGRVRASGSAQQLMTQLDLPLAQGDAAASIIEGVMLHHNRNEHLSTLSFPGGELLVCSTTARPLGQPVRVRVQARDVSLTLERQSATSVLNIVAVTVTDLREDSPGQWMVALESGGARLLARVTQRSVLALSIAPGSRLFAQVKGVALLD